MYQRQTFYFGSFLLAIMILMMAVMPAHAVIMENQPSLWWDFNTYTTIEGYEPTYCIDNVHGIWLTSYNDVPGQIERSTGDYAADFSQSNAIFATAATTTGMDPITGAYAMEFDIYIPAEDPASGQYVLSMGPNTSTRQEAVLYGYQGTEIELHANPRTNGGPTGLNNGTWHKVVLASYGNSSGTEGWVNKLVYSVDGGTLQTMTKESGGDYSTLYLDRISFGGYLNATGSFFTGAIDNFAVYDLSTSVTNWDGDIESQLDAAVTAISTDQQRVVSGGVPSLPKPEMTAYSWAVLKDNPTYYYSFNEADANQVAIDSVRGQDNDRLTSNKGATRTTSYTANLGQTAIFDGDSCFFTKAALDDGQMAGAYAIEFWIKDDSATPGSNDTYLLNVVGKNNDGNSPTVRYGQYGEGHIELWADTGGLGGSDSPTITDNDWHHVAYTFYGDGYQIGVTDRLEISIDGVITSVDLADYNKRMDLRNLLYLGAANTNGDKGFTGCIDEFAIYDLSGMTESEISAKMTSLAGHYALASGSAEPTLAFVDANQISYIYDSGEPSSSYRDSTGRELVDGNTASTRTYLAPDTVGVAIDEELASPLQITFDLSETTSLDSIWIDYVGGGLNAVDAPESVDISFSTDGINFTGEITFTDFNNESFDEAGDGNNDYRHSRRLIADVGGIDATYVRLDFTGATNSDWIVLSEVQFITDTIETSWTPGDANKDGKVDGSDVTILAGNWQTLTGATWDMGDFNGDGKVDGSDVTILAGNWQSGVTTAAASVPEPSTFVLLLATIVSLLIWKRTI